MYYIYIITNKRNGTLYIGVTNDLIKRIYQHKKKLINGFSKKYALDKLIFYESCEDIHSAIKREKVLKAWRRIWKIELIEKVNPNWRDLYEDFI